MPEVVARLAGVAARYRGRPIRPAWRRPRAGGGGAGCAARRERQRQEHAAARALRRAAAGRRAGRALRAADRVVGPRRAGASVTVLPQGMELPHGFRVSEVVALGRIPHARSWFATSAEDEAAVARALVDADVEELADRGGARAVGRGAAARPRRPGAGAGAAPPPPRRANRAPRRRASAGADPAARAPAARARPHRPRRAPRPQPGRALRGPRASSSTAGACSRRVPRRAGSTCIGCVTLSVSPIAEAVTADGHRVLAPMMPETPISRIPD